MFETEMENTNAVMPVSCRRLPVMEDFYTIQGEGFHTGGAAYFIRLGGCDVGCVWCDVKESWKAGNHPQVPVEELVQRARSFPARTVVVTGGEPMMHDLDFLTGSLKQENFRLCLETSGAYPLSGTWDWICVSPKKFKSPLREALLAADELKVVIYNRSDFEWAEQHRLLVSRGCKLFLQPEYSVFNKVAPLIVEYVKANPVWNISLQAHKVLNIP